VDVSQVELLWIPLGSGGPRVVRVSGRLYERVRAFVEHRSALSLYHAALRVRDEDGTTSTIEVTPALEDSGPARGVVRTGPVGARFLGRWLIFRYEIRCWPHGIVPDADAAVPGPIILPTDRRRAMLLLTSVVDVPVPVWGRPAPGTSEMWNSNSVVAWLLTRSGHDLPELPTGGRAPGWRAGVELAG
jgi:hypothetical protein